MEDSTDSIDLEKKLNKKELERNLSDAVQSEDKVGVYIRVPSLQIIFLGRSLLELNNFKSFLNTGSWS